MSANNRRNRNIDGLADTQMAHSSGRVFENTAMTGERSPSRDASSNEPSGGTLTDGGRTPQTAVRGIQSIQRTVRYDILSERARGGLGRILEARDQHLGRMVAIKELLRASTFTESLFIREALITARLQHPGIVPVHEAGRWPSGDPYYIMKLLSGQSMQVWIRDTNTLKQRMALLPNVIAVVETMAYAHSQGVIHRDIKPANIVIGAYGETVVVDWGLARDHSQPVPPISAIADAAFDADSGVRNASDSVWHITGNYSISGKVVGTPAYMSPEQARGEDVDESTDVYALGALLYELLSGKPPYPGSGLQDVLEHVLAGPPRPLEESLLENGERVKRDLIAIVEKAMARQRGDRYPSAKELAEDLKRFHTGQLVSAHQYTTWTLVRRWTRKHRTELAVVATAIVLLAITGIFSVNRVIQERNIATAERAQARAAQRMSERQRHELLYLQAEGALKRDPTATLAWLRKASPTGVHLTKARALYRDALSRGVAKHVLTSPKFSNDVQYLPDGETLVTADQGGAIRLVEVSTGAHRLVALLDGRISCLRASPDGRYVAAGTQSGHLYIISLDAQHRDRSATVHHLEAHAQTVAQLAFSADGKRLMSFGNDHIANIWDVSTGTRSMSEADAQTIAISPRFDLLYVSRKNGVVDALSTRDGMPHATYALPRRVLQMVVSDDGRYVAAYDDDWYIHLIDIQMGESDELARGTWPASWSRQLAISPQGTWLAAKGYGYSIHLWNIETKQQRMLLGHTNNIYNLYFSTDESRLISVSDDATARVWDTDSDAVQELRGHADDIIRGAIAPSGEQLATLGLDGSLRIWNLRTSEDVRIAVGQSPGRLIRFLDERSIVYIDHEARVHRTDISSSKPENIVNIEIEGDRAHLSPNSRFIASLAKSKDGTSSHIEVKDLTRKHTHIIANAPHNAKTGGWAQDDSGLVLVSQNTETPSTEPPTEVFLWTRATNAVVRHALDGIVCTATLAPGAQTFAVLRPSRVDILTTQDAKLVGSVDMQAHGHLCHGKQHLRPRYAPNGEWLTMAHPREGLLLVHTKTLALRHHILGGLSPLRIAYSHDSSKLAVHHRDRSTHLLNLITGTERLLGYHGDLVYRLVFSPDDTLLASGSHDQTIRIWNLDNDTTRELQGHSGAVFDVAFSPDGRIISSISLDRTIRVWHLDRIATPDAQTLQEYLDHHTTATIDADNKLRTPTTQRSAPSISPTT